MCDGLPYLNPFEGPEQDRPPLSPAELTLMQEATEDDLALANACLEIEQELRQRGWDAVEHVTALAAGRHGTLPERINTLPDREAIQALCDLYEARWMY